jgi:hypothetical protein
MSLDELDGPAREFLVRLYEQTQGDPGRTVSLYAVGESLGMDRPGASAAAQALIGCEWVEIRSLSGAIAISAAGVEAVRAAAGAAGGGDAMPALGDAPVAEADACRRLDQLVAELKARTAGLGFDFDTLAEFMADIQTLAAQLGSPRPKTAILRACLASLAGILNRSPGEPGLAKIRALLGR